MQVSLKYTLSIVVVHAPTETYKTKEDLFYLKMVKGFGFVHKFAEKVSN